MKSRQDRMDVANVADAIRAGNTVHREVLLEVARLVDPKLGTNERTAILERVIVRYDETGTVYTARD